MVMDVVTMTLDGRDASPASAADAEDEQDAGACDMANIQHDYYSLRPSVVSLWRDSHLPACSSAATSLIPETQVFISFFGLCLSKIRRITCCVRCHCPP